MGYEMQTANEDIEWKLTIDEEEITGSCAGAVAGTPYNIQCNISGNDFGSADASGWNPFGKYSNQKCRKFKFEIRKTTAAGANDMISYVCYGDYTA